MTDIGPVPNNYVSDGEIIAWLETKQTEQSSALSREMFTSDSRIQLEQDLTTLKTDIGSGQKSATEILAEMESIRSRYADTDLGPTVDSLLLPMEAQIAPWVPDNPATAVDQVNAAIDGSSLSDELKTMTKNTIVKALQKQADSGTPMPDPVNMLKDSFDTQLDGAVDKLGRLDQLDLIKIQELVSDSRQTMELGSSILSDRHQTSGTIIANTRV